MKVFKVSKWVLPLGYGLTLYKIILVRKDSNDLPYVVAHENAHLKQWVKIGFFKFPFLYTKELLKNGYKNNKYEVSARKSGLINRYKYLEYKT